MRCEVNASCRTEASVAVVYEEYTGGNALLIYGCRAHVQSTLWHYGTPCVLVRACEVAA